jgi:murein DD-endopeptidase MepM/ murein hydrolase activator NlpD
MKKIKYYYNTNTLRYEKLTTPLRVRLLRVFGFLSALIVSCILVIFVYSRFIPDRIKPAEVQADKKYELLTENYKLLRKELNTAQENLAVLEKRDNEVYRSIFEQNPLPDSARAVLIEKQKAFKKTEAMDETELGKDIAAQITNLNARMAFQTSSYKGIETLITNQTEKLSSIPGIQPISNKELTRIASGFGYRIHPIYGIAKMHSGLDFTAPLGTPIYATGNGVVTTASYSGGAGNLVVINHGYGYETKYMHMVRIKTAVGQVVKRGEVIGWVGSTGASTGPHCHYEVHVNGVAVDPVYFFSNDLNPAEFDRMLKIAATGSAKSFD